MEMLSADVIINVVAAPLALGILGVAAALFRPHSASWITMTLNALACLSGLFSSILSFVITASWGFGYLWDGFGAMAYTHAISVSSILAVCLLLVLSVWHWGAAWIYRESIAAAYQSLRKNMAIRMLKFLLAASAMSTAFAILQGLTVGYPRYLDPGLLGIPALLHAAAVFSWFLQKGVLMLSQSRERQQQASRIETSITEVKAERSGLPLEEGSEKSSYRRPEFARVLDLIASGDEWATIGLVGIRGTGKTKLQTQLLRHYESEGAIAFSVSCPTHIDEREIVVNLFDRLCHAILRRVAQDFGDRIPELRDVPSSFGVTSNSVLRRYGIQLASLLMAAMAGSLAALLIPYYVEVSTRAWVGPAVAVFSGLLTYLTARLLTSARLAPVESKLYVEAHRRAAAGKARDPDELDADGDKSVRAAEEDSALTVTRAYVMARRYLRDLEHERSSRREVEAAISPMRNLGVKIGRSEELTRRTMTLPGLIDSFIDLVEIGIAPSYGRVVIAIDELDRVVNPEQVRDFLRRVKALLAVPHVSYLLSVSEDVVESFELHAVSAKGEADSAFSDVIRLSPLSVSESCTLLHQAGSRLSNEEAICLAALSGGIPRDLLRYQRRLVNYPSADLPEGSSLLRFLRSERDAGVESFVSRVRFSDSFDAIQKEKVIGFVSSGFSTWDLLSEYSSQGTLRILDEILESETKTGRLLPRVEQRHLLLCFLVRLGALDAIHQLMGGGRLSCDIAESLRMVIERYSFSPIEAARILITLVEEADGSVLSVTE